MDQESEVDIEGKQYIDGSIFPEKFVFDNEIDRTARMNLSFQLIYALTTSYSEKKIKMELALNLRLTPTKRTPILRTHQFLEDLKVAAGMKKYIEDLIDTRL